MSFVFQHSDMIDEMRAECVELSITACEKFTANYEVSPTCNTVEKIKILRQGGFHYYWFVRWNRWRLNLSKRQWTRSLALIGMWLLVRVLASKCLMKRRIFCICISAATWRLLCGSVRKMAWKNCSWDENSRCINGTAVWFIAHQRIKILHSLNLKTINWIAMAFYLFRSLLKKKQ